MNCNFITWTVLFVVLAFVIYLYTSKLPMEQYDEQYGELEYFLARAQDPESSDSEEQENFTLTYSAPICYNKSRNDCINTPGCKLTSNGYCQPATNWYSPWYNRFYNWYGSYRTPYLWSYPNYSSSYSSNPTYYRYRYPRWRRGGERRVAGRRT